MGTALISYLRTLTFDCSGENYGGRPRGSLRAELPNLCTHKSSNSRFIGEALYGFRRALSVIQPPATIGRQT